MRKKIISAFIAGAVSVAVIGMVIPQTRGIFILDKVNTGEVKLAIRGPAGQAVPYVEIDGGASGTTFFQVASNGVANMPIGLASAATNGAYTSITATNWNNTNGVAGFVAAKSGAGWTNATIFDAASNLVFGLSTMTNMPQMLYMGAGCVLTNMAASFIFHPL